MFQLNHRGRCPEESRASPTVCMPSWETKNNQTLRSNTQSMPMEMRKLWYCIGLLEYWEREWQILVSHTVNRQAKSQEGIIGFTLRKGALLRWLLTRHVTGSYAEAMKAMSTTASRRDIHDELGSSKMKRNASDVGKIIDALVGQHWNPLDLETVPTSLINIVTGQVATQ